MDACQHGYPGPGPQCPTGDQVLRHKFFVDWTDVAGKKGEEFDFVIVGSGVCGYATAKAILENDKTKKILMLERGPYFLPEHFQNLPEAFRDTLGLPGLTETFPWTLTEATAKGQNGTATWNHGMIPFFGGRSTLWSSWCPRPAWKELEGWPQAVLERLKVCKEDVVPPVDYSACPAKRPCNTELFNWAEDTLQVQKAGCVACTGGNNPVYEKLQATMRETLMPKWNAAVDYPEGEEKKAAIWHVYRAEPAPLASRGCHENGTDFLKWSAPGDLLQLIRDHTEKDNEENKNLKVVTEAVVTNIRHENGKATAVVTNKGNDRSGAPVVSNEVSLNPNAHVVLAMGTLPPTTLVRNSFPNLPKVGETFSAHFISSITAAIPVAALQKEGETFSDLEIGAMYVAGVAKNGEEDDFGKQFHIQLSGLYVAHPKRDSGTALRYMPDVVATASPEQLEWCKEHKCAVFVCAVLGELDIPGPGEAKGSSFRGNPADANPTTNSELEIFSNSKADKLTWDAMDQATYAMLEKLAGGKGKELHYWNVKENKFQDERYTFHVEGMVHESSTMPVGKDGVVNEDGSYALKGVDNVHVTGGSLWPRGGSWNPTMTMTALCKDMADHLVTAQQK
eukprot:TRINITY_DN67453_c5_g2_i1.p1 TRINITY_DN67453_c5_g2~~TRINITY_DN67453_c5_g2_i1.p1  ORF type:complete len:621 (+),score=44.24 TRINITY_DN67453_c5_g2_i1:47-1909(+)